MVSFGYKNEISFNLPMLSPSSVQLMTNWQLHTEEKNKFSENQFVTKNELVSYEKETPKQSTRNR